MILRAGTTAAVAALAFSCSLDSLRAEAPPRAYLESATIGAASDTVTITRIPVRTSSGATVYKDVVIKLDIASDGSLSLRPGFPEVATSPNLTTSLTTSRFIAGRYRLGNNI
jgi:hypothetical protein